MANELGSNVLAYLGNFLGLDATEISHVAATVCFRIGIDELVKETGLGRA
jgi:hypothetical protein